MEEKTPLPKREKRVTIRSKKRTNVHTRGRRGETQTEKCYIAIDLKSFFASVECVERGLNPMTTNLVVADAGRTEKTICLAVSPALKAYGLPGRARLFEVVQKVREVNAGRRYRAPGRIFTGKSHQAPELAADPSLELDYIVAPPQMAHYLKISTEIYHTYLKYVAPEDIHVYSIDEVFIDATPYLKTYRLTAREFAMRLILDVLKTTGITATAGIGTNLYLCKVAMDIVAKHINADKNGVRTAQLNEMTYRRLLWEHRPLTDFWRVGPGTARKLEAAGMFTMGDIALRAEWDEEWFYRTFGVNAGLLLDHVWGVEPCTIADIKSYRPASCSLGGGQVLHCPYPNEKARLILREMTEVLALELVEKRLVADQVVLTVGYDIDNLNGPTENYRGEVTTDRYGRKVPKQAHGSENLGRQTASQKLMTEAMLRLFERITDPTLLIRRLNIVANHVIPQSEAAPPPEAMQLSLFGDAAEQVQQAEAQEAELEREQHRQEAIISIKNRYGKNAILKGSSYLEGATARDRNKQIGGHKA